MKNVLKEQLISNVEAYTKTVENETLDKVLNLIRSKYKQLNNILSSPEAYHIITLSTGQKHERICETRRSLIKKMYKVLEIFDDVNELRYGKM